VWDDFLSKEEVALLRAHAASATEGLPHRGAEVSTVLPGSRCVDLSPGAMQARAAIRLAFDVQDRVARALREVFGGKMELQGALLRQVRLPASTGPEQM
ncbi:PRX, partial [Symbiodinium microadriaticum]